MDLAEREYRLAALRSIREWRHPRETAEGTPLFDFVVVPTDNVELFPIVVARTSGLVRKILLATLPVEDALQEVEEISGTSKLAVTNIAQQLDSMLANRGSVYTPEIDRREEAFIRTRERASKGFFKEIRSLHPDGYFVGVGIGNALSVYVNSFSKNNPAILIDKNPCVVAFGKVVVAALRRHDNPSDFVNSFLGSEVQFRGRIQEIIEAEDDQVLKQHLSIISEEEWGQAYKNIETSSLSPAYYEGEQARTSIYGEDDITDPLTEVLIHFPFLRKMALAGNIAIVYADLTDPNLIQAIRSLPHFTDTTPVIYMSGIVDHFTDYGRNPQNISAMDPLRMYEEGENDPIFIEDTAVSNYYFRMIRSMP